MTHNRPRVLFLFSDTGGGHRSAAEAIIEAIHTDYGAQISTEMVDIFKDYAPRPLNLMPDFYTRIVRVPQAWGIGYRLSNGHKRARILSSSTWPYIRPAIQRLVVDHPCDLVVSVHPLATAPVLKALGRDRPPFITMVTDLVTTHAFWYHRQTDLCLVPTEAARLRALRFGITPEKVIVVGLPVDDRFCRPTRSKDELRDILGWPKEQPTVLLVGGGEGMGPLESTAHSISQTGLPITLVIITGRNQRLRDHLQSRRWPIPTFIYGFVRDMPDFMRAADILVTKAGPGTISEALNTRLPMILYSRLPGQEDGNVAYIESEGAGVWAPQPEQIAATLRRWFRHPQELAEASEACKHLAKPLAAHNIARIIARHVGIASQAKSIPVHFQQD